MPENLQNIQEQLLVALSDVYVRMIDILPQAVLALIILVVGIIIGSIISTIAVKILQFFAVDKLVGKTPLDRVLHKSGIQKSISQIIGTLLFWFVLLVTFIVIADLLKLEQVSEVLTTVSRFIPQVIAAIFIIVLGMLLSRILQTLVEQMMSQTQLGHEKVVGKVVQVVVLLFVFIAAFEQIGIDLAFLTTNVMFAIVAILLIVGIGFIVASKTVLENIFAMQRLKAQLPLEAQIEIGSYKGKVKSFTTTGVTLSHEGKETIIPAVQFFSEPYTVVSNS